MDLGHVYEVMCVFIVETHSFLESCFSDLLSRVTISCRSESKLLFVGQIFDFGFLVFWLWFSV